MQKKLMLSEKHDSTPSTGYHFHCTNRLQQLKITINRYRQSDIAVFPFSTQSGS